MKPMAIVTPHQKTFLGWSWLVEKPKAIVVIITGMEEHASRYDAFAKFLNQKSIAVYALDHLGQGRNAADETRLGIWEPGTFEETVLALKTLIDGLPKECSVTLLGHSLGSFITQRFVQLYSDLIDKAVLSGTNHEDPLAPLGKLLSKVMTTAKNQYQKAPFFNDLAFGKFAKAIKNRKTAFDWLSYDEDNVRRYIADPYCGYVSTFSFWKELLDHMVGLYRPTALVNIRKDLPILIASGKEDPVGLHGKGPTKVQAMYLKAGLLHVQLKLYDKMRHEILNETHRLSVYEDIAQFVLN